MPSAHPANAWSWRRIYTDASLLRAVTAIAHLSDVDDAELVAISSIAHLDHALVVAGAAGIGRHDLIVDIIALIQNRFLPSPHFTAPLPPAKSKPSLSPTTLASSARPVPRVGKPPSLGQFQRELISAPVVISGLAHDWPAVNDRLWSSLDYLRSVAGRGRIVPVEVGSDYRNDGWYQEMMRWEDFLASLADPDPSKMVYLAQHNLLFQFPALRDDICVPDYVYSAPDAPSDYPDYKPPSNPEQLVVNAWLGPKGTISPAHTVRSIIFC
jgi:hypothetical protein